MIQEFRINVAMIFFVSAFVLEIDWQENDMFLSDYW